MAQVAFPVECGSTISRNFYSSGSAGGLLIFWYRPYSLVSASLVISRTRCEAVELDFCAQRVCQEFNSTAQCTNYLIHITKGSQLKIFQTTKKLTMTKYNRWSYMDTHVFEVKLKDNCSVLQLRNTKMSSEIKQQLEPALCSMHFFPGHVDGHAIRYSFFGFLMPNVRHSVNIKHSMFKGYYKFLKYQIKFLGSVGTLFHGKEFMSTPKKVCNGYECSTLITPRKRYRDFVLVQANVPRSTFDDLQSFFQFQTSVYLSNNPWIDVMMEAFTSHSKISPILWCPFIEDKISNNYMMLNSRGIFSTHTLLVKTKLMHMSDVLTGESLHTFYKTVIPNYDVNIHVVNRITLFKTVTHYKFVGSRSQTLYLRGFSNFVQAAGYWLFEGKRDWQIQDRSIFHKGCERFKYHVEPYVLCNLSSHTGGAEIIFCCVTVIFCNTQLFLGQMPPSSVDMLDHTSPHSQTEKNSQSLQQSLKL